MWWHHVLFWLGIVAIGYVYFRFALPGFRKFGPCQDETNAGCKASKPDGPAKS